VFVPKIPSMKITDLVEAMCPGAEIEVVGIRPGEKLHEMMICADDARCTAELGDRYAIEPAFVEYPRNPFRLNGGPGSVPENFSYASDTNAEWLSADALLAMVEEKAAA
jgi:UDP-N-acetylglucosamine 4,6-dehydratase